MTILEIRVCNLQVLSSSLLFITLPLELLELLMKKEDLLLLPTTAHKTDSRTIELGSAIVQLDQLMILARVAMPIKERAGLGLVVEYTEGTRGTLRVIHRRVNRSSHKAVPLHTLTHFISRRRKLKNKYFASARF